MRLGIVLALAALVFAQPALAVITFTQLDDDLFERADPLFSEAAEARFDKLRDHLIARAG